MNVFNLEMTTLSFSSYCRRHFPRTHFDVLPKAHICVAGFRCGLILANPGSSVSLWKKQKMKLRLNSIRQCHSSLQTCWKKQKYYSIFCVCVCVRGVRERGTDRQWGGGDVISELHRTGQEVLLNMCSVVVQCCASLPHRKRVVSLNLLLASSSSACVGSHVAHEKLWPLWPLRWCSVLCEVRVWLWTVVCLCVAPRDGDSQSRVSPNFSSKVAESAPLPLPTGNWREVLLHDVF